MIRVTMDDRQVVESVLAGDREAFEILMDRYQKMVFGACLRMTGNVPDAEELAHDTFVEAYLKLDRLKDPDRVPGWLKTIALNMCKMWFRQRSRLTELTDDLPATESDDTSGVESIGGRMYYGLSRLSPAHRMVMVLHYIEGLSYEEIAKFLELPIGTVMSRLNRARHRLREEVEEMTEDQDIPMISEARFKEEVQAEISVLLEVFQGDRATAERMAVVLRKSPERLAQLIRDAIDETILHNLAVLLPRLGRSAMECATDAYLSSDSRTVSKARVMLESLARRARAVPITGSSAGMPSIDAYVFADQLIERDGHEDSKAELLVSMMEACEDEATGVLLTNLLMCYPEPAHRALIRRFLGSNTGNAHRSPRILQALVRTGRLFCVDVLDLLKSDDEGDRTLGLVGIEAIARSLDHPWIENSTETQYLEELRTRDKWPPLRSTELDPGILRSMARQVSLLADDTNPEIRDASIRVLGHLGNTEYANLLRAKLSDSVLSTRLAAIFAVSEMGDSDSADRLIEIAEIGETPERIAAIKALGRLRVDRADVTIFVATEENDTGLRDAAIIALGELGKEDVLRELVRSSDANVRRVAAKALFGGPRVTRMPEPSETDRKLALKRQRSAQPVAFVSVDAVMRFALPELRTYDEKELTRMIAGVCEDYCTTRRYLVELGLMTRQSGLYEFTDLGAAMWRVERFITDRYLRSREPEAASQPSLEACTVSPSCMPAAYTRSAAGGTVMPHTELPCAQCDQQKQ